MTSSQEIGRRFGWISPNTEVEDAFNVLVYDREITDEMWAEYSRIVDVIGLIRPFVIDYLVLEKDFLELERMEDALRKEVGELQTHMPLLGTTVIQSQIIAQRAVSNFLASSSAFRDRTRTLLVERFGDNSHQVEKIKAAERSSYDASFAYRLLYNLRNYSQHHTSPLDTIDAAGTSVAGEKMNIVVRIELIRDTLLKHGTKIQRRVRDELSKSEERIELLPLAREFMQSHIKIFLTSIEIYAADLFLYADYLRGISGALKLPPNAKPMIFESSRPNGPKLSTKMHSLGADEMEFLIRTMARLRDVPLRSV